MTKEFFYQDKGFYIGGCKPTFTNYGQGENESDKVVSWGEMHSNQFCQYSEETSKPMFIL